MIKQYPNHVLAAKFRRERKHRALREEGKRRQAEYEATVAASRAAQKSKACKRSRPAVNYDERD